MTVIITGGSGAIGSMCAYQAAKEGYDIVLCYNNDEKSALNTKKMLEGFNVKIELVKADITKSEQLDLIEQTAKKLGYADILINNAGYADIKAFLDTDENETAKMMAVNLESHINLTRKIIPHMLKKGKGSIVNISSVWGIRGASCEVLYSAAKAGIIGFTKALAKELAPSKVTVNCVAPGCIESKMLEGLDKQDLCDIIPLGRIGDGLEVAKAVFFLAKNDYITGQTLSVDGGMNI